VFGSFFYEFGLNLQFPLGSSDTSFWLLFTFKVLNFVIFVLCSGHFFTILDRAWQTLSGSSYTKCLLLFTFEVLNILFWKMIRFYWFIWCSGHSFMIFRAWQLRRVALMGQVCTFCRETLSLLKYSTYSILF
jgi:hypothetical protein